jgi:hypothetical protein
LATISGLDPRAAAKGLWKAMVAGLVVADGENYFVLMDEEDATAAAIVAAAMNAEKKSQPSPTSAVADAVPSTGTSDKMTFPASANKNESVPASPMIPSSSKDDTSVVERTRAALVSISQLPTTAPSHPQLFPRNQYGRAAARRLREADTLYDATRPAQDNEEEDDGDSSDGYDELDSKFEGVYMSM